METTEKLAQRLEALAASTHKVVEEKRRSAEATRSLPHTRRRSEMARGSDNDAASAERLEYALLALAQGHRMGTVPDCLRQVTNRLAVQDLLIFDAIHPESRFPGPMETCARMASVGIGPDTYPQARAWLLEHAQAPDRSAERQAVEFEEKARSLVGVIPGFFPTPPEIVERMIELAAVEAGDKILDPSAGSGAILDVIARRFGTENLSGIEFNMTLCDVLRAKGHQFLCADFLEIEGHHEHDVVLMNPPFERGQDAAHVAHALDFVKPVTGCVVAVVSESCFFRQESKYAAFRDLLAGHEYDQVDLPAGAFARSGTGVKARIVALQG